MRLFRTALLALVSVPGTLFLAHGQSAQPGDPAKMNADQLFRAVSQLDKEVFDDIDRCDMKAEANLWAETAEFYHDKAGLMTGRDAIVKSIQDNLCGKMKRELVPGTLEVYPIAGYGAVEIGVHRFLHPYETDHGVVGEAKFMHLWQYSDGHWRITRVISYGHETAK